MTSEFSWNSLEFPWKFFSKPSRSFSSILQKKIQAFFGDSLDIFQKFVKNHLWILPKFSRNCSEIFLEFFENSLGILWEFYWNSLGILRKFFGNSLYAEKMILFIPSITTATGTINEQFSIMLVPTCIGFWFVISVFFKLADIRPQIWINEWRKKVIQKNICECGLISKRVGPILKKTLKSFHVEKLMNSVI